MYKRLLGKLRKCMTDFEMISPGDKICIGVSGGKDSLALLTLLANTRRYFPIKYELEAVTLKMGLNDPDYSHIEELCKRLDVNYTIRDTQIAKVVFEERKEQNPCSLCANMRRGALHGVAKELGCNKVALGHHRDDLIETFLMCTTFEGRLHTFSPVTYLSRADLTMIRPMLYIEESEIVQFCAEQGIEPVKKTCQADGYTNREYMKELIKELETKNPDVRNTIFGAMKRGDIIKNR